ncbi:MAG: IclR family transcriptional regulator [Flavobacteriaceae bacterium]
MGDGKAAGKGARTVQAVRHLADILRCVSKAPAPIGVNEVARQVGLDKSSVSRLLASLEQERFVQRGPDGRVRVGTGLLAVVAPLMRDLGLSTRMRPSLEALAKRIGETVNLSIWGDGEAVSVVQALGSNAVTHFATPGRTNPPHCTASGKVLLAFGPTDAAERVLAGPLARHTESTVTDPAALRRELEAVRSRGFAVNEGEFEADVSAVSAPVFDLDASVLGALTVTVPAYRFDERRRDELIAAIVAAAKDLSEQFGYRL